MSIVNGIKKVPRNIEDMGIFRALDILAMEPGYYIMISRVTSTAYLRPSTNNPERF